MKRRITALLMVVGLAMMMCASPALAGDGGATVEKTGNCGTGLDEPALGTCHLVITPSGIQNLQVQAHPQQPGRASGGGATHVVTECITPQPGKAVITPSGNASVHCTGKS